MRTLQEKYNAIQEGKFSKDHFLAEARMQQPQLVTRFNGYDDAVQILKNRGMIVEAKSIQEFSPYGSIAFSGEKEKEKETAPLSSLEVGDLVYIPGVSGDNITVKDKREDGTVGVGHPHNDKVSYQDGTKEVQVVRRSNLKEARLTKNNLTDYRYKATNEMDKYPYEQILRGIRVELEVAGVFDTPTAEEYAKALAKVSKNLAKDSIFYTNQVAGVNPKVDLHDKMITATAKNTVDTFNGMKKAELKEGFKKLIKKVLSEEVMDVESYKEEEDEVYEMYGEDSVDESKMGDVYLMAQEHDRFEHFVQAVEDEFGPVDDIAELEHIFNATRGEDDIDYGDENFSDPFIDGDLDEATDTEADKNMVRKLMAMYETDPSKFERLHKQTETQAKTTQDIAFRRVLSLMNRAKAGALQRSTPEIPGFEGTRDALDNLFESKSLKDLI